VQNGDEIVRSKSHTADRWWIIQSTGSDPRSEVMASILVGLLFCFQTSKGTYNPAVRYSCSGVQHNDCRRSLTS